VEMLSSTNNLPEVTGRVCPALCESACVLGINDNPITIRENELAIIEHAFKKGFIKADPPKARTGKRVAVIGSGPAGLSCAAQLNSAGHTVTVFEKADRIGGLMRYGIPDFKLDKSVLDRRIKLWKEEGIEFKTGVAVNKDIKADFDAVCFAGGSRVPRDLKVNGRELKGIYFAMDYLSQSNRLAAGDKISDGDLVSAKGKRVVVIGGGDTGSDCVGTANRQGAKCVVQLEVMPQPPECRDERCPWPKYPLLLKTTSSHEEGVERRWAVLTKKFTGSDGHITRLQCVRVDFSTGTMKEVPGTVFEVQADLVLLAIGFLRDDNLETDDNFMTKNDGVFCCGDQRRGQSLVVHAISEGRQAAYHIDRFLMGRSGLPKL
ncbi:MAG: glutamate synthase subunit beta, partial [Candidatus Margulisiibacteriota bacterium]